MEMPGKNKNEIKTPHWPNSKFKQMSRLKKVAYNIWYFLYTVFNAIVLLPYIVLSSFVVICVCILQYTWLSINLLIQFFHKIIIKTNVELEAEDRLARGEKNKNDNFFKRPLNANQNGVNELNQLTNINQIQSAHIPKIQISRECINKIANGINEFRKESHNETGYALIGEMIEKFNDQNIKERILLICGIIGAGQKANYSSEHVKFDREYQQRELEKIQLTNPKVEYVGDIHLHPAHLGAMTFCSSGDLITDLNNVKTSKSQELIFIITTVKQRTMYPFGIGKEIEQKPEESVFNGYMTCNGLRFDFYYLGYASNYYYYSITPEVISMPIVEINSQLSKYLNSDIVRTTFDFEILNKLPQFYISAQNIDNNLALKLTHKFNKYNILLFLPESVNSPPYVIIENQHNVSIAEYDFLYNKWSPLIWLSQIVLEIEKTIVVPKEQKEQRRINHEHRKQWELPSIKPRASRGT